MALLPVRRRAVFIGGATVSFRRCAEDGEAALLYVRERSVFVEFAAALS